MPTFRLSAKPAIAAAIQAGGIIAVTERISTLVAGRGYVVGPNGMQVLADGSVTIEADRDPSADWAAFDPSVETATETADRTQREQAKALYAAVRAGTATNAQVQKLVAFLLRQEFRDLAP